jgi:ankyrin repeat protein
MSRDGLAAQALLWTETNRGNASRVRELLAAGADPDCRDGGEQTLLMAAAASDDRETVAAVLPVSRLEERDELGMTALMWAARLGGRESLAALLEAGADPMAVDARGRSALHWTARHGKAPMFAALAPVSDIERRDEDGMSIEDDLRHSGCEEGMQTLRLERARRERAALALAAGDAKGGEASAPRKPLAL